MKLVIDANVVISALIADSKTRELIVTLEPDLLTPALHSLGRYRTRVSRRNLLDWTYSKRFF